MSTGKVDLSGEELTVGIDGMLTFDESVTRQMQPSYLGATSFRFCR